MDFNSSEGLIQDFRVDMRNNKLNKYLFKVMCTNDAIFKG